MPERGNDPRWALAIAYAKAHAEARHLPKFPNFKFRYNNGLLASYLSYDHPSFMTGYPSTYKEQNIRQNARALVNIGYAQQLTNFFSQNYSIDDDDTFITFQPTRRVNKGADKNGITGCPEALYQLQVWDHGRYIGRVGFNIHKENGANVVSFTNVQGVPGYDYKAFSKTHGSPPFNIALATAKKELPNIDPTVSWMFRGIINPKEGDTRGLYRGVFQEMDIPRVRVTRNNDFFQFG